MVHEQDVVLRAPVPVLRVVGELVVEIVVGAERVHQRRLVVRRAPHPAVGHARPGGDRVALADQVLARVRDAEELVGEAAVAGVGRAGQHVLGAPDRAAHRRAGDRARGVAERRMRGDVVDALAVDVDLAAVAQAFEIFLAGERPVLAGDTSSDLVRSWAFLLLAGIPSCGQGRAGLRRPQDDQPCPPRRRGGESRRVAGTAARPIDCAEHGRTRGAKARQRRLLEQFGPRGRRRGLTPRGESGSALRICERHASEGQRRTHGSLRPAAHQRHHARLDLRADRHRLHDGVRHHRHGELRPWRRVHGVGLHRADHSS